MPRPSQQAIDRVKRKYPDLVAVAETDDQAAVKLWRLAVATELIWISGVKLPKDQMPPKGWQPNQPIP